MLLSIEDCHWYEITAPVIPTPATLVNATGSPPLHNVWLVPIEPADIELMVIVPVVFAAVQLFPVVVIE